MNVNDVFESITWVIRFILISIEIKWPILLVESVFLAGGIMLIITGVKIRKQSKPAAFLNILTGTVITLGTMYLMLGTLIFGYNS